MFSTRQVAQRSFSPGPPIQNGDGRAEPGQPVFPEALVFKMPDGLQFICKNIDPSLTLMDVAENLRVQKEASRYAFHLGLLGVAYTFSFNGSIFPAETSLKTIHEEIDLNKCGQFLFQPTEAKKVADQLTLQTGREWRVLKKNTILCESNPFKTTVEAVAFCTELFERIPHLKGLLEVSMNRVDIANCFSENYQATIKVTNSYLIKALADGIPIEIAFVAPVIAQAVRNGHGKHLGMLPLDILAHLGTFLAPELPDSDGYRLMKEKIEESNRDFFAVPVLQKVRPAMTDDIRKSIGATIGLLLRSDKTDAMQAESLKNAAHVDFTNAGLEVEFSDEKQALKFSRALELEGYLTVKAGKFLADGTKGRQVTRVAIPDFNEIKRFVEERCGYPQGYVKKLFDACKEKLRLPAEFFLTELELIGQSPSLPGLEQKKAAARQLMNRYLPYVDPAQAEDLRNVLWHSSRPDEEGEPGPLQFLRQKRGAGRVFSRSAYSDNVATFKGFMAAIDGVIAKRKTRRRQSMD